MGPSRRSLVASTLLILLSSSAAFSFHRDTHYYLRFALALSTCFDWDEAHLVASGDWMLDQNATTVAEMNPIKKASKIGWHAFGHNEDRLNELWLRALAEEDAQRRLVKVGQFMHFLEDWEAHAGFGVRLGHAKATIVGRDPDSLGRNANRNRSMVQTGLVHLIRVCGDFDRPVVGTQDADLALARLLDTLEEDALLEDLFSASDPKWLKGNNKLGTSGLAILDANQVRVEQFIRDHLASDPSARVPTGFEPGEAGSGIPLPLLLRYDEAGELILPKADETTRGAGPAMTEVALNLANAVATMAPFDATLEVTSAMPTEDGWRVGFVLRNLGPQDSVAGVLEFVVIDARSEEPLGEISHAVEALEPGETMAAALHVPTGGSEVEVIIGGYAAIDDGSAESNQSWFSSTASLTVNDVEEQFRGPGQEAIILAGEPRLVAVGATQFCSLVRAYTSGGDASEKLGELAVHIDGLAGGPPIDLLETDPAWCAVEAAADGRVVAQTVLCSTTQQSLCGNSSEASTLTMSLTIDSDSAAVPLEVELPSGVPVAGLDALCESR